MNHAFVYVTVTHLRIEMLANQQRSLDTQFLTSAINSKELPV